MEIQTAIWAVKAAGIVSVAWMILWWAQVIVIAMLFDDDAEFNFFQQVIFCVFVVTVAVMERKPHSQDVGFARAFATWGVETVFGFWLSLVQLIAFAFGVIGYVTFALARRVAGHSIFASYLFGLMQIEAGVLDPDAVQAEREVIYNELAMAQMSALDAQRRLQINNAVRNMEQAGISQGELMSYLGGQTYQQTAWPQAGWDDVYGEPDSEWEYDDEHPSFLPDNYYPPAPNGNSSGNSNGSGSGLKFNFLSTEFGGGVFGG